jgi:two-component system response regulator ChvI
VTRNLRLNSRFRRASWRGRDVPLTQSEFAILERLALASERDVAYRDLYDVVRGPGFVAGAGAEGYRVNVRAFVKRIRQKFKDIDPEFDAIRNYPGVGYSWHDHN